MEAHAIDERFAFASQVIAEAARVALAFQQDLDDLTVTEKGPQDLVSEADRAVEDLIRNSLAAAFPEDGFVGEETGRREASEGGGIWVVDPIDGTQDFLLGFSTWCVSIAFVVDDLIVIGLITSPATGHTYAARRGSGATCNGEPIHVRDARSLADGVTGVGCSTRTRPEDLSLIMQRLLSQGGVYRGIGSGAMSLVYVATGQCLGYVEMHINAWDCFAAICLVTEAGGRVTDFLAENGPAGGGPIVAAGPRVFDQVSGLLP